MILDFVYFSVHPYSYKTIFLDLGKEVLVFAFSASYDRG